MQIEEAKKGMRIVWNDLGEEKLCGSKNRRTGEIVGIGEHQIYVKLDGVKSRCSYSPSFWKEDEK